MSHLNRGKISRPWGNTWAPTQKFIIMLKSDIRMFKRLGYHDHVQRAEDRLKRVESIILEVGVDRMNMLLWNKHGKDW